MKVYSLLANYGNLLTHHFNDSFLVSSLFRFVMSVVSSAKFMNLNNTLEWAMSFIKGGLEWNPEEHPLKYRFSGITYHHIEQTVLYLTSS